MPPDPADGPPVPPLWQAAFDPATLDQYFADLAESAEVLSVQAKAGPGRYAAADPLSLADARARLTGGEAAGVQVRYRYDGHEWTDTVLRTAGGYRLVRCQIPTGDRADRSR